METFDYEFINRYNGMRSPTGTVENDFTTKYFMRCLYQRMISVIDFKLPEGWNKNYFRNVLFRNGFIGIVKTPKFGVIPQVCTLTGYGLYMQPTDILVSQPLVQFRGEIGKDCSLIMLTPDYSGTWDIVEHTAIQLSTIYTSIKVSLENSRMTFLLGAKNKSAAETLKIIAEKISSGEPVIVYDKKLSDDINGDSPIWTETFNAKDSYITDKLLSDMKTILENFDREIGIPTVDSKRERMITDEVIMMNADACARLYTWMHCLDETIEATNKLFDLDISYKIEGGAQNEPYYKDDDNRYV